MLAITVMSLFAAAVTGCSDRGSGPTPQESNLRLVAVLYSQYVSAHGGEAPLDAADFREFIQTLGPGVLERAGITGFDELLVSRRDGTPFALKFKDGDWTLDGAIAYEQVGSEGTRYIASDLGGISQLTEEQFQQRIKGRSPAE